MYKLKPPRPPAGQRSSYVLVHNILTLLGEQSWLYYVGYVTVAGAWSGAVFLCFGVGEGSRLAVAAGGLLAVAGGLLEIFLAPRLAQAREETSDIVRFWEEGWTGLVDYGPATFRFFGAAAAGFGFGAMAYSVLPILSVGAVVAVVACLAIWVWTWFAFPGLND